MPHFGAFFWVLYCTYGNNYQKHAKKRLVLLDAHAIIHRAYHALPEFSSSTGEPTGALYGVVTMLFKLIEDFHPDYIVACYDLPQKHFDMKRTLNIKQEEQKRTMHSKLNLQVHEKF